MFMIPKKSGNNLSVITFLLWVGFVVVSWLMLFRQELTLAVIGNFYPRVGNNLFAAREILLKFGLNSWLTLTLFLIIIFLFYIYWKLLVSKVSTKTGIFLIVGTQLLVFFSYPFLSTDIFDYVLTGRLGVVYHQNIWATTPAAFPNDPFYQLGSWQHQLSPYGATNQFFYGLVALVSGNDLVINIVAYKLLVALFVFGSILITTKILNILKLDVIKNLILVFANPLFIIETAGSAHNIIITMFFLLAIFYFTLKKRWLIAGIVSGLSIHTKFVPVFLVGLEVLNLFRLGQWKNLVKYGLTLSAVILVLFLFTGTGVVLYLGQILFGKPIYWQSLPRLIHQFYSFESPILLLCFLAIFIIQVVRFLRGRTSAVEISTQLLFIYLLFFVSFYLNWYVLWLLIFVPFISSRALSLGILFLTFSSALIYPVYMFSLRFGHTNPLWSFLIYFTLVAFPLGAMAYDKFVKKVSV